MKTLREASVRTEQSRQFDRLWRQSAEIGRVYVVVRGIVQGVGFRPFVHRLAHEFGLHGWVLNSTEGVEIELEGPRLAVQGFLDALPARVPPAALIESVQTVPLPPVGYTSFIIQGSQESAGRFPLVSPDIATCPDCLSELSDPTDRRYRYPFINCTNCGPRFTIVEGVPYDRPKTTMRRFIMCPVCRKEYEDPADRRFHAQPNACPECGPRVWLRSSSHAMKLESDGDDAVRMARRLLQEGHVLAIKGLGGFHLACDATNEAAVNRLRARKRRVEKPFAIMVYGLETAARLCKVNSCEAQLLASPRRPIVLLERREGSPVVSGVAPQNSRLGLMLPYTPLHHLLLAPGADITYSALVMTSGNLSEEPIAADNDEALGRLDGLADYFVLHDRPIGVRCDDSVTQVFDEKETVIRRSRGYAPLPIRLGFNLVPVLACGAELKNTFCLAEGHYAFLSQHIGDLENEETLDAFVANIAHFKRLFRLEPQVVAHDLHPDYLSTRYALDLAAQAEHDTGEALRVVAVQHHHAHVASCLAENGLDERVIGVAFDGTGYGTDGHIWGGEFLIADYKGFERVAQLRYVPLPGGDAAVRRPYRMAYSYLRQAFGRSLPAVPLLERIDRTELAVIDRQVTQRINAPLTSSCGRLFDAVSALLRIREVVNYEGQAAMELEMRSRPDVAAGYDFALVEEHPMQVDAAPVISAIVHDLEVSTPIEEIGARFHNAVAKMVVEVCGRLRDETGLQKVCLSGGVFQNRLLLRRTLEGLLAAGFQVFTHHLVPCNDGGIALGQAMVASKRSAISS